MLNSSYGNNVDYNKPLKYYWLFFGFVCGSSLKLFGEIYLGEILIPILYFMLNRRQATSNIVSIFFMIFLWGFIWQLISDLYNESNFTNLVKGCVSFVLVALNLICLTSIFKFDHRNFSIFLIGVYLCSLFKVSMGGYYGADINEWKWGWGPVVLNLFLLAPIVSKSFKRFWFVFIFLFAFISLLNGARSMAFLPLLIFFYWKFFAPDRIIKSSHINFVRIFLFLFAIFSISFVMDLIFSSEFFLSFFPSEDAIKYKTQALGKYGMFLGGRNEIFISLDAFLDSPLFGHGSWAVDTFGYISEHQKRLTEYGYLDNLGYSNEFNYIPFHSYLMGALVWGGLPLGLVWFAVLFFLIYIVVSGRLNGFVSLFMAVTICWGILFSPFGAAARWQFILYFSYILIVYAKHYNIRSTDRWI